MSVEERDVGSVSWHVYWLYVVALGGVIVSGSILLFYALEQAASIIGSWWLAFWSEGIAKGQGSSTYYLNIYSIIGFATIMIGLLKSLIFAFAGLNSARHIHDKMLFRVIRAPMAFFDTTPLGRVLNRFSKDIYTIDEVLPRTMGMFLNTLFGSLGILIVITIITPEFLCALIPLGYIYHYVQQFYVASSREVKRLDSISRSPIFAHFTETLSGISLIRAFGKETRFIDQNEQKLDENQKAFFVSVVSNRWLGVRVEFIGTCVVSLAALAAVLARDNISSGMAGLSITYALSITATLNWLVRMSTELETQLVSVERVMQYCELEIEAPPIILATQPPDEWPQAGAIEFKNVKLKYRKELDYVLKGIDCKIQPREKIGIVGRTGAGKSSLMLALFRLAEPEGKVMIDGVDISKIGLDTLRSRLSIIPQDPTLFTGTIRSNLDPFEAYEDEELWYSLERVHLKKAVEQMPGGLDAEVQNAGENLSVGQRQLLCLGRALLRHSKILVMDEATAAVDYETDALIQQTIRQEFRDMTVLTIAHRINTIIDYDRVMVLDRGRIAEFDKPSVLLQGDTIFASLANTSSAAS